MALGMRLTAPVFLFLCACSSGAAPGMDASIDDAAADTRPPRDPNKNCVKPGTKNNELGVGGYCDPKDNPPDCITSLPDGGTLIRFCTAAYAPDDHWFCTMPCTPGDDCGAGAYCGCDKGQCGCVPDVCGDPPPRDASADAVRDAPAD
jgi:hypothetical protein